MKKALFDTEGVKKELEKAAYFLSEIVNMPVVSKKSTL